MFGLGVWEIILILVIVMIVFGVGKLPEIGSGLGEGIKNFKKSFRDESKDIAAGNDAAQDENSKTE